jgi:type II secretory pathway pseudopilin PulG
MEEYKAVQADMQHKKKKNDLIAAIIIVIILAIAAVGGTWYYMNNKAKKDKKVQEEQIQQLQKQIDDLKKLNSSLVISDWSLSIPNDGTLDGITFTSPQKSTYDTEQKDEYVAIVTPALDSSYKCAAVNGVKASIGNLTRTTKSQAAGPYKPSAFVKIGQYTYDFYPVTNLSSCFTDINAANKIISSFQTQLQNASIK